MFRGSIHYVDAILWLGRNAYPADRNEYYDSASKIYMSYPPIPVDPRLNAKKVKIHRTQNRWKRMPGTSRVMHWNSKYFKLHFAPPYFSMTRKNKNATATRRLQIANAFYIEINVLSVYHSFPLGPSIYAHWFYSFIVSFGMLKRHTDQRYTALYGPNGICSLSPRFIFAILVSPSLPAKSTTSVGIQPVRPSTKTDAECKWDLTADV